MMERNKLNTEKGNTKKPRDRIEGRNIFLHSQGKFPKGFDHVRRWKRTGVHDQEDP